MIDYTVTEHNAETGEVIIREMTDEEKMLTDLRHQNWIKEIEDTQKVAEQKTALLNKLGITEEEAKLLLS